MEDGIEKAIFVQVGRITETVVLPSHASTDDVKDALRRVAGVGQCDVIKLCRADGQLINPGTDLIPNSVDDPYNIYLAATTLEEAKITQLDLDLMDLETRLRDVEETVAALRADLPPVVAELRRAVESFKTSLESTQVARLPVMHPLRSYEGDSIPCPRSYRASSHPYWERVHYRRKVEEDVARVFARFRQICDSVVVEETAQCLRLPTFNNWAWEDWEVLMLLQHMYLDLGFPKKFDIEIEVLRNFLSVVYLHYNQVPFHNFQHAFCVTQMMYGLICKCDLQERLGDLDVMILLTSCICHDLDHPGFNNLYQINARTELALRYNDISPLENHHCSIAFQILERNQCNIFRNMSHDEYRRVREGMIRCILATDMARHNEILRDFKEVIPIFDFENRAHVNLLFMILIKVADISNEARPLDIAEPWLECLMQEFFNQSDLEKLEGLPVSPFMDREKVTKPTSQCSFIGFVLLPLFEALGEVLPELEDLIIKPVRYALDHYRRLKDMTKRPSEGRIEKAARTPGVDEDDEKENKCNSTSDELAKGNSNLLITENRRISHENLKVGNQNRDLSSSLRSSLASSRSSLIQHSLEETSPLPGDSLENISETEVAVMERTSRFKISTEAPITASQKSSFERRASNDGRSSAEGRRSCDSAEERSKHEKRVSIDGRGRDEMGLIGRLYSKEPCDGNRKGDNKLLLITNVGENDKRSSLIVTRTEATLTASYLDDGSISERESKEFKTMSISISEPEKSFVSKSNRSCGDVLSDNEPQRFSVKSNNDELKVNVKRTRSKSVADQPCTNRTYSIAKSKINFRSSQNPCDKPLIDETKLLGTSSKLNPIVSLGENQNEAIICSPTRISSNHPKQFASDSNNECADKLQSGQKKLSQSLDVLPPRRNGKSKREQITPQNTPASSEDNLINPHSNPPSEVSSPKPSKKRSETSRNLIFTLLKRSPVVKEEDQKQNSL